MLITQALLHRLFTYDERTGALIWNSRPREDFSSDNSHLTWNAKNAGKIAGSVDAGKYRRIGVFGHRYRAHRLIWLFVHGVWPENQIDHASGDFDDNSIKNLRDVPNATNAKNRSKRRDNTSGHVGVNWKQLNNKWAAKITVDGRQIHIGLFSQFEDAVAARKAAEREYGFHPNHGRSA